MSRPAAPPASPAPPACRCTGRWGRAPRGTETSRPRPTLTRYAWGPCTCVGSSTGCGALMARVLAPPACCSLLPRPWPAAPPPPCRRRGPPGTSRSAPRGCACCRGRGGPSCSGAGCRMGRRTSAGGESSVYEGNLVGACGVGEPHCTCSFPSRLRLTRHPSPPSPPPAACTRLRRSSPGPSGLPPAGAARSPEPSWG